MRGIKWNPTSGRTLLGPPRTSKAMADLPPPQQQSSAAWGVGLADLDRSLYRQL